MDLFEAKKYRKKFLISLKLAQNMLFLFPIFIFNGFTFLLTFVDKENIDRIFMNESKLKKDLKIAKLNTF